MKILLTSLSLAIALSLTGCNQATDNQGATTQTEEVQQQQQEVVISEFTGKTMGTTFSVKWIVPEGVTVDEETIKAGITQRLIDVNKAMSTYDKTSEITKLNEQPAGEYTISDDFYKTLVVSQEVSEKSAGAFDATVSPLINIWGFGHKGKVEKQPTAEQIATAKEQIGYQKVKLLGENEIEKTAPVTINLSAVAKGYGVDAVAVLLADNKLDNYFVEIGGEVVTKGKKDGSGWKVGIEKPTVEARVIQEVLDVSDASLATSGDYRNYFEENGVRFSHTIDPTTGAPINHKLASVSVLHKTCAEADAYATALMVMGDEKGVEFAKKHNIDALFIVKSDDESAENGFVEITTGNFAKRILTKDE